MQIQNAILTGSTTVYGPITFVSGTLAGSASYAATSSYADTFTVAGSLTAQTIVVQTITSSVSFITGSTRFGSLLTNTHTFTGSMFLTGSAINVNNSKAIIGDDVSYGAAYQTLAFGSATNGFNRISGHSSTNDGLYFMAATGRGFSFRPNGSTIGNFIIASTGRVGIGTNLSSPSALLHISGSGSDPLMQISSTVSSSIFFVSGSGNIGIGTTTPTAKLDIRSSGLDTNVLSIYGTTSGAKMFDFRDDSASGITAAMFRMYNSSGTETVRLFPGTVSAHHSWILPSGNFGIGTTSPNGRFEVATGSAGVTVGDFVVDTTNKYVYVGRQSSTSGDNTTFVVRDRTGTARATVPGGGSIDTVFSVNNSNFNVTNYGGTSLFFISGSGNVGIGITSPGALLHIFGAGSGNSTTYIKYTCGDGGDIRVGKADGVNNNAIFGTWSNNDVLLYANSTERMRITSGGDVLVGTTSSPSAYGKLIIRGTNQGLTIQDAATNGYRSIYSQSGNLYFYNGTNEGYLSTAGTWVNASDATLKKDIKDIEYGLNKVLELKPKWYKMIDNNLEQIGFIAQDVEEVLPELVSTSERGMKGLSYGQLTAVLVKAIQELSTKLEEATTRIKTLESK